MKVLIINNEFESKHFPKLFDLLITHNNENEIKIISNYRKNRLLLLERVFLKLRIPIDLHHYNKRIIIETKTFKPTHVLFIKPNNVFPKTIQFLKKNYPEKKYIFWTGDNMDKNFNSTLYYHKIKNEFNLSIISNRKYYDNLICSNQLNSPVFYLEKGFDPRIHYPGKNKEYFNEVLFIGTYEKERFEYMNYLAENGIQVHVYGNNWNVKAHSKLLHIHRHEILGDEFRKMIHQSKICLNFLRQINQDVITSRTFEIPATGGFMLSERTEFQKRYFKEDKETVFFSSKGELLRKARFYLNNDTEREIIRKNGIRVTITNNYSLVNRANELLDIISKS
jgi:spore maturation protein CgeB